MNTLTTFAKQLSQRIGIPQKIRAYLQLREKKLTYVATIKPILKYGSSTSSTTSNENILRLFELHLLLFITRKYTTIKPTSNSLTQKYIHFIQSTFTSVDTQAFASKGIPIDDHEHQSANRRPLTPF